MDVEAIAAALSPEVLAPPIAKNLRLRAEAVRSALALLAEGAQPAYLVRYRPERIAGLSIVDLERIQGSAARAAAFEFKRHELLGELASRGGHHAELIAYVRAADHPLQLEDARSAVRRRKRGPAAKARAAGLGALAQQIWRDGSEGPLAAASAGDQDRDEREDRDGEHDSEQAIGEDTSAEVREATPASEPQPEQSEAAPDESSAPHEAPAAGIPGEPGNPEASAEDKPGREPRPHDVAVPEALRPTFEAATRQGFPTAEAVVHGVQTICAERMAEYPPLRGALRLEVLRHGRIRTQVVPEKREKAGRYSRYFDFQESCSSVPANQVLAISRGEREGVLRVHLELEPERVLAVLRDVLQISETPSGEILQAAGEEAWQHGLGRAVLSGARKMLKEWADREAISEYISVFRPLLLAPAMGAVPVLAIDPGFQNGCRIVVLDATGQKVAEDTVFPLQPKLQAPQARARILELAKEHAVRGIVVANSNGGREVERLCRELARDPEAPEGVVVAAMDPDPAALFAAGRPAKEEFPGSDAATRRAISLGRRAQDPLAELIRVDPRKLGLGQHQHEVDQEELRTALEQVIVSCVSEIGLDLQRATSDQLSRVAGISHAVAKAIVTYRETHGTVRSRAALLDVPGYPGKAFEQSAGFLHVFGGEQPLDATKIHPERYGQVGQMARDVGVPVGDLLRNDALIDQIDRQRYLGQPSLSGEPLGELSLQLILDELRRPGADPRPPFETVDFDPGLGSFDDLKVGMELEGIVTHLAPFGAFVDVGLSQEGLIHISEISHEYIANPLDAVHVGQKIRGRVIEVAADRKRFSISLKALIPRPERPARRGSEDRDRDRDRPPRKRGKGAPEGRSGGGSGGAPGKGPGKGGGKGGRGEGKDRGDGKDRGERVLGFRLDLSDLAARLGKG